ncbi:MAG: RHS repeat-associated core domain-containing protein, partial [bacterium]
LSNTTPQQSTDLYTYDAYGNLTSTPQTSTKPPATGFDQWNTALYSGKELDAETGLSYYGSRYYAPTSATWNRQDDYRGTPSTPLSRHRYAFVENNPTNNTDAYGFLTIQYVDKNASAKKETVVTAKVSSVSKSTLTQKQVDQMLHNSQLQAYDYQLARGFQVSGRYVANDALNTAIKKSQEEAKGNIGYMFNPNAVAQNVLLNSKYKQDPLQFSSWASNILQREIKKEQERQQYLASTLPGYNYMAMNNLLTTGRMHYDDETNAKMIADLMEANKDRPITQEYLNYRRELALKSKGCDIENPTVSADTSFVSMNGIIWKVETNGNQRTMSADGQKTFTANVGTNKDGSTYLYTNRTVTRNVTIQVDNWVAQNDQYTYNTSTTNEGYYAYQSRVDNNTGEVRETGICLKYAYDGTCDLISNTLINKPYYINKSTSYIVKSILPTQNLNDVMADTVIQQNVLLTQQNQMSYIANVPTQQLMQDKKVFNQIKNTIWDGALNFAINEAAKIVYDAGSDLFNNINSNQLTLSSHTRTEAEIALCKAGYTATGTGICSTGAYIGGAAEVATGGLGTLIIVPEVGVACASGLAIMYAGQAICQYTGTTDVQITKKSGGSGSNGDYRKLSDSEASKLDKYLKENGYPDGLHDKDIKPGGSKQDVFVDKNGDLSVKPKNGSGPGEPLDININDL